MKIELDYVKVGDYYLPDLTIEPPPDRSLGKYGMLRLRYLKEHRPVVWAEYVMEGKLYAHLLETEDAANNLLENMMPGMASAEVLRPLRPGPSGGVPRHGADDGPVHRGSGNGKHYHGRLWAVGAYRYHPA